MTNSQPAANQEMKGGMVLYPREYVIDPTNSDNSYVVGADIKGRVVVAYIIPTEQAKANARDSNTAQSIPSLEEFSQTHRKAMHPCFASKDNSYASPSGVLLLEQISPFNDCPVKHDLPVYKCKWASILRETDDSPLVPMGYGFLEINCNRKFSDEINEYINRYNEIDADIKAGLIDNVVDADQEKMRLHSMIMSKKKKWFIAVILKNRELIQLTNVTEAGFVEVLRPFLERYTEKGMYGGAMIRVRDGNTVLSELCSQCDMSYDYKNLVVRDVKGVIDDFLAWDGKKIIRELKSKPQLIVEIIPTQRINCGKIGNDRYNKDLSYLGGSMQIPKTLKTYVSSEVYTNPVIDYKKEKKFLYSMIAVRVAEIHSSKGTGNLLVSAIHAFSAPIGNVFSIDESGKPAYIMNNSEWAKKQQEKAAAEKALQTA